MRSQYRRTIEPRRAPVKFAALLIAAVAALPSGCANVGAENLPPTHDGTSLRVASLNVHYLAEWTDEPLMSWDGRDQAVVDVLAAIDADLVAFQEMETFTGSSYNRENRQQATLERAFPGFAFAATGEPPGFPNTQPVMYRRERLEAGEQGFFFYGPEPDVPFSDPWLGRYSAYATWVRLRDREDGSRYLVVNLHIDRTRYRNQLLSADLTVERASSLREPGERLIVLGDFNAPAATGPVRRIRNGLGLNRAAGNGPTFHFYRGINVIPAIDHILYDPRLESRGSWTVRLRPDDRWPSDHYPVVADLVDSEGGR